MNYPKLLAYLERAYGADVMEFYRAVESNADLLTDKVNAHLAGLLDLVVSTMPTPDASVEIRPAVGKFKALTNKSIRGKTVQLAKLFEEFEKVSRPEALELLAEREKRHNAIYMPMATDLTAYRLLQWVNSGIAPDDTRPVLRAISKESGVFCAADGYVLHTAPVMNASDDNPDAPDFEEMIPDGIYYLEFLKSGVVFWPALGTFPDYLVITALSIKGKPEQKPFDGFALNSFFVRRAVRYLDENFVYFYQADGIGSPVSIYGKIDKWPVYAVIMPMSTGRDEKNASVDTLWHPTQGGFYGKRADANRKPINEGDKVKFIVPEIKQGSGAPIINIGDFGTVVSFALPDKKGEIPAFNINVDCGPAGIRSFSGEHLLVVTLGDDSTEYTGPRDADKYPIIPGQWYELASPCGYARTQDSSEIHSLDRSEMFCIASGEGWHTDSGDVYARRGDGKDFSIPGRKLRKLRPDDSRLADLLRRESEVRALLSEGAKDSSGVKIALDNTVYCSENFQCGIGTIVGFTERLYGERPGFDVSVAGWNSKVYTVPDFSCTKTTDKVTRHNHLMRLYKNYAAENVRISDIELPKTESSRQREHLRQEIQLNNRAMSDIYDEMKRLEEAEKLAGPEPTYTDGTLIAIDDYVQIIDIEHAENAGNYGYVTAILPYVRVILDDSSRRLVVTPEQIRNANDVIEQRKQERAEQDARENTARIELRAKQDYLLELCQRFNIADSTRVHPNGPAIMTVGALRSHVWINRTVEIDEAIALLEKRANS